MPIIRKAIFPVGDLGTELLPATKTIPTGMLPVLNRPLLQYAIDEAKEAGIEEFIFITGRNKAIIHNHFDVDINLELTLNAAEKPEIAETLREGTLEPGKAIFINQQAPLGLGHAILCARHIIGDEQFAVILPHILTKSKTACLKQLVDLADYKDSTILAIEEVSAHNSPNNGITTCTVSGNKPINITGFREDANQENTDTNFAVTGRYIFPSAIFRLLREQQNGSEKKIVLNRAIQKLIEKKTVIAHKFEGVSFNCSSRAGLLMANLTFALEEENLHPQLIEEFIRLKIRTKIDNMLDSNTIVELADVLNVMANRQAMN